MLGCDGGVGRRGHSCWCIIGVIILGVFVEGKSTKFRRTADGGSGSGEGGKGGMGGGSCDRAGHGDDLSSGGDGGGGSDGGNGGGGVGGGGGDRCSRRGGRDGCTVAAYQFGSMDPNCATMSMPPPPAASSCGVTLSNHVPVAAFFGSVVS